MTIPEYWFKAWTGASEWNMCLYTATAIGMAWVALGNQSCEDDEQWVGCSRGSAQYEQGQTPCGLHRPSQML